MAADTRKRGLGRGLDALFQDARNEEDSFAPKMKRADEMVSVIAAQQSSASPQRKIPIDKLKPGSFQPRRRFDDAALDNLAESIVVHGILQPLLVRPLAGGMYEIIAGERRWRAAQKAQIHDLPVIVQELNDNDALEISLIENLQREDLTALEEAEGYQRLMDEFRHTQDVLAHHLGKSRSHVANTLRLLKLPERVKQYMQDGALSAGHARCLVGCGNAEEIAGIVVARGLNVRQTEKLVKGAAEGKAATKKSQTKKGFVRKDVDVLALEEKMSSLLGMKVTIESAGPAGSLRIEYKSLEQLDDVLERLSCPPGK
ncbi:MAG: ParB/RepB/Spo0J family partition protein [Pseudomonadota bacterium]